MCAASRLKTREECDRNPLWPAHWGPGRLADGLAATRELSSASCGGSGVGEGTLLFPGSPTWNWNYRFRSKARVCLRPLALGLEIPIQQLLRVNGERGAGLGWV